MINATITDLVSALVDFVYPARCCVCDEGFCPPAADSGLVLEPESKSESESDRPADPAGQISFSGVMKAFLCPECARAFTMVESPLCDVCGQLFKSRQAEDHLCGECHLHPKSFDSARAVGIYDQSLMKTLQKLKYNSWTGLARPLGALLLWGLTRWYPLSEIDLIVPVPLHPRKLRARGFNQVVLMLRQWPVLLRRYGIDRPEYSIAGEVLVRCRKTRSQTRLTKKERRENVRGAFAVKNRAAIIGRNILLVDDVYTTGATVDECARVLKMAGSGSVDVLTVARVR